ncbi:hypothetical protein [Anoxynatronum buryatiense]|uniref:Uncharacterized protein n=1 Tax=Anoxynatronum buryatiense TaxID=489973 RepID=A0AA45WTC1_9CLOT|nr:hypothetical protein [Anoxynatronum buryatiense]SMP40580.1 hypothetical protein SAMN06296020_101400 [Anoxynatronum buryatiense]
MLNAKREVMEKEAKVQVTGMCLSCAHQDGCAMTHHGGANLYGCEEFESAAQRSDQVDYREEMKTTPVLGLCATCDSKNQCAHKTAPGGVWHCEEYR